MELEEMFKKIIEGYTGKLKNQIDERKQEMEEDNNDHYLIYNLLGFSNEEGYDVDYYQNVGRFLYKYAGSLIEELAIECFKIKFSNAKPKVRIKNSIDKSPKTFEIDCLVGETAYEIKWKDATTDGDHIKKEHKRVRVIKKAGYKPVRIMFFKPNRGQAIKIQSQLEELYKEMEGFFYSGEEAWEAIKNLTDIDLRQILIDLTVEG